MSDREPPLARDLSAVSASYTWKYGEGGVHGAARPDGDRAGDPSADDADGSETARLRSDVTRLTGALEDVVALALSGADYKERAIMMHRRAVAALSGMPVGRASTGAGESAG